MTIQEEIKELEAKYADGEKKYIELQNTLQQIRAELYRIEGAIRYLTEKEKANNKKK